MKRAVIPLALTAALLIIPLLAAPAEARHDSGFSVGGWFSVGGVHFSLVFGSRGGHHHPDYYYRTDDRVRYRGHRCTDRCYRDRGDSYHSIDCPVVGYHMDRHHQRPHMLFRGYAPAPFWRGAFYGGFEYRGWGRHDRDRYYDRHYDRHHRYDRYDRHDRHDRWDRRDRGRHRGHDRYRGRGRGHDRHRHGPSCGHDWRHRHSSTPPSGAQRSALRPDPPPRAVPPSAPPGWSAVHPGGVSPSQRGGSRRARALL